MMTTVEFVIQVLIVVAAVVIGWRVSRIGGYVEHACYVIVAVMVCILLSLWVPSALVKGAATHLMFAFIGILIGLLIMYAWDGFAWVELSNGIRKRRGDSK